MFERYRGKRFAGFGVAMGCLTAGYFWGPVAAFGAFSTAIGVIYGAYLTGQSATDHRAITVNGGKHE